jgi:phage-related holin
MPSKLLSKYGLNQKEIYSTHLLIYVCPVFMFAQLEPFVSLLGSFNDRVFNDWDFFIGLMFLVFLDTLVGGLASILEHKFSARKLYKKLGSKVFGICISVACIGILKNTLIGGEENLMAFIVDSGFYSIMMGFEGASVLKNSYKIYPWEPIRIALSKLEIFYNEKTGKVTDKSNDEKL